MFHTESCSPVLPVTVPSFTEIQPLIWYSRVSISRKDGKHTQIIPTVISIVDHFEIS
jgi:hypothetical protein